MSSSWRFRAPNEQPAVAVYDCGAGGLPTVQDVLLRSSGAATLYVADDCALVSTFDGTLLRQRLLGVASDIVDRGADLVLLSGGVAWAHADVFHDAGLQVVGPEVVMTLLSMLRGNAEGPPFVLAPTALADSALLTPVTDRAHVVLTDGLASIIDRDPERDELVMATLADRMAVLASTRPLDVLVLDSHLGLVVDLLRRLSPGTRFHVPGPLLAAAAATAVGMQPGPSVDGSVEIWCPTHSASSMRRWTDVLLQLPGAIVIERELAADTGREVSDGDVALLFYASLDAGVGFMQYLADEAADAEDTRLVIERTLGTTGIQTEIDETLRAGGRIGVVGRRVAPDGTNEHFSHMLRFADGRISGLEVVVDDASAAGR